MARKRGVDSATIKRIAHGALGDLRRALLNEWPPYTAITLAERNGVVGDRESQRRIIRFAIAHLRNKKAEARVCAGNGGYWLARNNAEWEAYLEARKIGARFAFVRERRIREAARDAVSGQLTLLPV